jgi:hypothetical protein
MDNQGSQKAFTSAGIFWLPEKPDSTFPGILTHMPGENPQLSATNFPPEHVFRAAFDIIHGVLDSAPCALFNCQTINTKGSAFGISTKVVTSKLLIVGENLTSLQNDHFDSCRVRFSGLNDWVGFPAIIFRGDPSKAPSGTVFQEQPPHTIELKELATTVKLVGTYQGSFNYWASNWEHNSAFEISFETPKSAEFILERCFELHDLFALLSLERTQIQFLSFFRSTTSKHPFRGWSGIYGGWDASSENRFFEPFTNFQDIRPQFHQILLGWLNASPNMKSARRLITHVIQAKGLSLDLRFLTLMQAVEGLHRCLAVRHSYVAESEYEAIEQAIFAAIPETVVEDHLISLQSKIEHGNDLSLRTKLKSLFEGFPEGISKLICDKPKSFTDRAVALRNSLTHATASEIDPSKLRNLFQRLRLLLAIVILKDLGLGFEEMQKIAERNNWESRVNH